MMKRTILRAVRKAALWAAGAVFGGLLTAAMAALIPAAMDMMHVLPAMNVGFFGGYMALDEDRRTWAPTLIVSHALAALLCGFLLGGVSLPGAAMAAGSLLLAATEAVVLTAWRRLKAQFAAAKPEEDEG